MSKSWSQRHTHGRDAHIAQSDGRVRTLETAIDNACIGFSRELDKGIVGAVAKLETQTFRKDLICEMIAMLNDPERLENAPHAEGTLPIQAASILAQTGALQEEAVPVAREWLQGRLTEISK